MNARTLLLITALLLPASTVFSAEFRAGAAVGDITPTEWPVYLVGSFSERGAEKAWDSLSARAVVLDDGETRLAIVVVDSCLIPRSLFDEVKARASKATGIRTDRMMISATHTHSAPASLDRLFAKMSEAYIKVLKDGIVEAIIKANKNLAPAEMGWGQVDIAEHVHNRRWHMKPGGIVPDPFGKMTDRVRMNPPRGRGLLDRPAGPIDPQLSFVSVRNRAGVPLALLANYSLHYVGGVPAGGVSADYFGEFARQIQKRIAAETKGDEKPFVGIMSNGTSGDINNINFTNPQPRKPPFEQIKYVASSVADQVAAAYKTTKHRKTISLAMAQRELTLDVRQPTKEQLAQAKNFLAEPDESKLPRRGKAYAQFAVNLAEGEPREALILQAIRIGDIGITSIPCSVRS